MALLLFSLSKTHIYGVWYKRIVIPFLINFKKWKISLFGRKVCNSIELQLFKFEELQILRPPQELQFHGEKEESLAVMTKLSFLNNPSSSHRNCNHVHYCYIYTIYSFSIPIYIKH